MNLTAAGSGSLEMPGSAKAEGRTSVDYAGHAGGAIAGFLFGLAFLKRGNTAYGKKLKYWGMALCSSYFILMLALLFTKWIIKYICSKQ